MPGRPCVDPREAPQSVPTLEEEYALVRQGYRIIAGLDEAGRGAMAGPLVAASVCLPEPAPALLDLLHGLRDSKLLTAASRSRLFDRIVGCARDVGIGVVSSSLIDSMGLGKAGGLALRWAVLDMSASPDCLLTDYFRVPGCAMHQRPIVHGDRLSLSIAAASVVAKVFRDRLMETADSSFPGYGFAIHKGYCTRSHQESLSRLGVSAYHRHSFAPVARTEMGLVE